MKKAIWVLFVMTLAVTLAGCDRQPQKVKVTSLDVLSVYRDCIKNSDGNYRDSTMQTTVNFEIQKSSKNSLKLGTDVGDCTLRIGPDVIEGFYITNTPNNPNNPGVFESGIYTIFGGELRGDLARTVTFCCQNKCDTAELAACQ